MDLKLQPATVSIKDQNDKLLGEIDAFEVDLKVIELSEDEEKPNYEAPVGKWLPEFTKWMADRFALELSASQSFQVACACRKEANKLKKNLKQEEGSQLPSTTE